MNWGDWVNAFVDGGIKLILELVFVAVLTGCAAIITRNWVKRGKIWINGNAGFIRVSPFIHLLGIVCGLVVAACLVLGILYPKMLENKADFIAWLGLITGFLLGCIAMVLFSRHSWEWNAEGLLWRATWRSVFIPWEDIASAGKTWDGQGYVADENNRKIKWTLYTLERGALRHAILTARPDLRLPEV